ncbi:hypothetical protein CEXT_366031 [Caerostris extrusa]|uniref:Uncharacterized protein n=1 Tax=Caerostris extrusa TaxID=172846 RepID=A0AAV4TFD5_CAEEX|nr:hypothetical protein CEXT_366031 [Caerostris extrusa]
MSFRCVRKEILSIRSSCGQRVDGPEPCPRAQPSQQEYVNLIRKIQRSTASAGERKLTLKWRSLWSSKTGVKPGGPM